MRAHSILIGFLGAGALAACSGAASPPIRPILAQPPDFQRMIVFTGTTADPCDNRTITTYYGGKERSFVVSPLFDEASRVSRLSTYCALRVEDDLGWPSLAALRKLLLGEDGTFTSPDARIGRDYIGLFQTPVEHGGLASSTWRYHYQRFMNSVGAVDLSELPDVTEPRPSLAIIDSVQDINHRPTGAGFFDHGWTLIRIAEELLCVDGDPSACRANIFAVPALRRYPDDHVRGSLGELAQAIVAAVNHPDVPDTKGLVINISLGWVNRSMGGNLGGDIFADGKEAPAAAAIHEALQYARCRGAVVVTASGNRVGLHDEFQSGPIRPAHWFSEPSLNPKLCTEEFSVDGSDSSPLVTAVAAVGDAYTTDNGRDTAFLASYRGFTRSSTTVVAANGLAAVVPRDPSEGDPEPTGLLSGTSVSTVVVSSIIAAGQRVGVAKSAREVEASLAKLSNLSVADRRRSVAVLEMSTALAQLEGRDPGRDPLPRRTIDRLALERPNPVGSSTSWSDTKSTTWCQVAVGERGGGNVAVRSNRKLVAECEWLQLPSVDRRPYSYPQPVPSGGGCPSCWLDLNGKSLFVQITDARYLPVFLEVWTKNGRHVTYALPLDVAPGGDLPPVKLGGLEGLPSSKDGTTARIIMADLEPKDEQHLVAIEIFVL